MSAPAHGQVSVALAGASGILGTSAAPIFLEVQNKRHFSRVIILTRASSVPKMQHLAELGAEIVVVDIENVDDLTKKLAGVDIVVNLLASHAVAASNALLYATVNVGAKVYFPSDYGVDYRYNDFPGFDSQEWIDKRAHDELIKKLAGDKIKVIHVATAAFLEFTFVPPLGFDAENETITTVGSLNKPSSFTSKTDIGRAIVRFSILASFPEAYPNVKIPEVVRIGGSTPSTQQIADVFTAERKKHTGFSKGDGYKTVELDLKAYKDELKVLVQSGEEKGFLRHIFVLRAEGLMDFSTENDNDLVNDGTWEWKTIEDYAKETQGMGTPF